MEITKEQQIELERIKTWGIAWNKKQREKDKDDKELVNVEC